MIVTAYKTHKINPYENLYEILDAYLPKLSEKSVVAITSKIISLCSGDIVKNDGHITKEELIKQEADYFIDGPNPYGTVILTLKDNFLLCNAGIDESNANGVFVLWPRNVQRITDEVRSYLRTKRHLKQIGVIVTDSRLIPMSAGVIGYGLSWSGFKGINNFIGKDDIYGRQIRMTKVNVTQCLATACVGEMGETDEQTPLAIVTNASFVHFEDKSPSTIELDEARITVTEDIYAKLLTSVVWEKGKSGKNDKAH